MSTPENKSAEKVNSAKKSAVCPICGKPAVEKYRPFCSKRCADLDLAHWLKGDYAVAAEEQDGIEDVWEDMASKASE